MSEQKSLFIIEATYKKEVEVIDELLDSHLDFLRGYYDEGIFLLSGPQVPRTGGIILARGVSKEKLEEIFRNDPFSQAEAAEYKIIEFVPRMSVQALGEILSQ